MKERPMRWVFCIAMNWGWVASARRRLRSPILRGSQHSANCARNNFVGSATFTRWAGFHVGGVVSYNNATTDFVNATAPLIHFSLHSTTLEPFGAPALRASAISRSVGAPVRLICRMIASTLLFADRRRQRRCAAWWVGELAVPRVRILVPQPELSWLFFLCCFNKLVFR
jgi:hypothetical protein